MVINAPDHLGNTPLFHSSFNLAAARQLITDNASVLHKNNDGSTLAEYIRDSGLATITGVTPLLRETLFFDNLFIKVRPFLWAGLEPLNEVDRAIFASRLDAKCDEFVEKLLPKQSVAAICNAYNRAKDVLDIEGYKYADFVNKVCDGRAVLPLKVLAAASLPAIDLDTARKIPKGIMDYISLFAQFGVACPGGEVKNEEPIKMTGEPALDEVAWSDCMDCHVATLLAMTDNKKRPLKGVP